MTSLPQTIFPGLPVVIVKDLAKMALSEELIPGVVPWPPGFKEEIDTWMREFFGTWNTVQDGEALAVDGKIYMNPRTYADLKRRTTEPPSPSGRG